MVKPNTDSDRAPHSDPPAVKRERMRIDGALRALGMLLAVVTDWLVVAAATALVVEHVITPNQWMVLAGGAGAATVWKKLTGRGPGSTTAVLLSFAPAVKAGVLGILAAWSRNQ